MQYQFKGSKGQMVNLEFDDCLEADKFIAKMRNESLPDYNEVYSKNKTFELMYENNCPKQFKCEYNPWTKEPSIDDIVDSLNSIKK